MMNNICRTLTRLQLQKNSSLRFVAYKSAISLDTIYPESSLKLTTPEIQKPISKTNEFSGYIPINEVDITYSRSTGAGGQNVNTLNTKVDLRFNVEKASWINGEIKSKLFEKYKTKITKEGYLVFKSELTRSQHLNLADCLEKVRTAIRSASSTKPEPTEETLEKIRRRQETAARERLMFKRQRSQVKFDRQAPNPSV